MTKEAILSPKLAQEYATIAAMVQIYCKASHAAPHSQKRFQKSNYLCHDCISFLDYAKTRLDRCPYGEAKPTCNTCPIHCYKPSQKQQAKTIMKFAGPRMLWHHPILAIKHLLHERTHIETKKPKEGLSNRHRRIKNNQGNNG